MSEWTILKLLDWTAAYFTEHGVPSPRLDAELLLSDILKLKRIELYLNFEKPVAPPDLARFKSLIQRRTQREPLQYILGHADFFGRKFSVTPEVLIPRPETEQLVVRALEWLDAHPLATRILDFGTGSGCIAITLALERPALQVTAVEASEAALNVARGNAEGLGAKIIPLLCKEGSAKPGEVAVLPRRKVPGGDKGESEGVEISTPPDPLRGSTSPCKGEVYYNLLISNPPYIPSGDIAALQPEVARFEPRLALDGGEDGLAFYRKLLLDAPSLVAPGGALTIEIGLGQRSAIEEIATSAGQWQAATCYKDLSDTERILIFERKD